MGVGNQDAVNLSERLIHNLLTEIGTAVDEQSCLFGLDECRTAQTLVLCVRTAARVALASDSRHATRGSRS